MQKRSYFILFFLIAIFIGVGNAQGIKVSPGKTVLSIKTGEANCTNIWVLPDKDLTITSLWSLDGRGDRNKYNLSERSVRVKINYTRLEYGKYEFCFSGDRQGYFYGIIFFQSEDSLVKMGIWIELDIESENVFKEVSLITGNAIKNQNSLNVGLSIIFVLLVIIFILVVRNIVRNNALKNKHTKINYSA